MTNAYIGLGSNLEVPQDQLNQAITALKNLPAIQLIKYSSFYLSKPMGPRDQPDYINAVAAIQTSLSALNLLNRLQAIETEKGRVRKQKWGPRILDLDLLLFGSQVIDNTRLQIPHPEMHKRNFVLLPLHEIAPICIVPGHGPVSELLKKTTPGDLIKIGTE